MIFFLHYTGTMPLAPGQGVRYIGTLAYEDVPKKPRQKLIAVWAKDDKSVKRWANNSLRILDGKSTEALFHQFRNKLSSTVERFVASAKVTGLV